MNSGNPSSMLSGLTQEALYETLLVELAHLDDSEPIDLRDLFPCPHKVIGETRMTMRELRRRVRLLRAPKPGPEQPPLGRRRHA